MKNPNAVVAPAAIDSFVDFNFIATQVFLPTRGRPVGITRNGLALMVERGAFPRPVKLHKGDKAPIRWRVSDLQKWIASRTSA